MEFLVGIFAFDVATFAIMSNHFHLVLRSRPDIVRSWSDEEVVVRNMRLHKTRWCRSDGTLRKSAERKIAEIVNNRAEVDRIRRKLSDVSSLMAYFDEHIAKACNKEDEVKGAFWEGTFEVELLESEADILKCMAYVDLNPVRAGMAESLEDSEFTGAYERLVELRAFLATEPIQAKLDTETEMDHGNEPKLAAKPQSVMKPVVKPPVISTQRARETTDSIDQLLDTPSSIKSITNWERRNSPGIGWLAPVELDERGDLLDADPGTRRPSRKGFLPMSLTKYLDLVESLGRMVRAGKRGSIPDHVAPLLQRIGCDSSDLLEAVSGRARIESYFAATERQGNPFRPFAIQASSQSTVRS